MPKAPRELLEHLGLDGACPHLDEALTHPSYANEHRDQGRDNQRLEFLGDAVLGLCVSELLMERFRDAHEGDLSLMRATLVNTGALAEWARRAELADALRLGRGADAAGERQQSNVLADAVEAIVGAVYIDLGLESARKLAREIAGEALARMASGPPPGRDPKSELQERVQARGGVSPKYRLVEAIGPDHSREFVVAVDVDGEVLGAGRGRSKKSAEKDAARSALEGGHPLTQPVTRPDAPPRSAPPEGSEADSARTPEATRQGAPAAPTSSEEER